MSLDVNKMTKDQLRQHILMLAMELTQLEKENAELKSELSKFSDSFKRYRDYEKEELAESCYDLARENEKLKSDLGTVINERDNAFKKIEQLKEEIGKLVMKD